MIRRDPEAATAAAYDLIVVGGGVYGISLVLEAAQRDLRPLLLETGDFGGATSWNSLRIVHGGLRYLQRADLTRFRHSVRERTWWLQHFPDLVFPLPCLMPLYGEGLRRPAVLNVALRLNDLLSRGRNEGLRLDRQLPAGRVLSSAQTRAMAPGITRGGLLGGALWYDGVMPDSQRLLIELLHWATGCGAVALNYVEAKELVEQDGKVAGIAAEDCLSGQALEFRAPLVVNCGGPWSRDIGRSFDRDVPELFRLSLAFNVLLDREPLSEAALAVAPASPGGRTYFLVPWKGKILAGTCHAPWEGTRQEGRVDDHLLGHFLEEITEAVPALEIGARDVLRTHWGFLPARRAGGDELATRAVIHDHGAAGGPRGLFSVSGVKFTTARLVAEKTLAAARLRPPSARSPAASARRPAPAPWLPREQFEELVSRDRARAAQYVRRVMEDESACHLDDLLLRRTDWGMKPQDADRIGRSVARLLGWDPEHASRELRRLCL